MILSAPPVSRVNRFRLLIFLAVIAPVIVLATVLATSLNTAAAATTPSHSASHHQQIAQAPVANTALGTANLFQANLTGAQEVPAVDTRATGRAVLALSDDLTTLHYRVIVNDIVSITMAHIHLAPPGTNGGIIFWLYDQSGVNGPGGDFGPGNPISGTLTLTPDQVDDLLAGDYYVNVHTDTHGSGEIRGQVDPFVAPPTQFNALLLPGNEVPPVESDALGIARFTFVNTNTLDYALHVTDIVSITMAHIHKAPQGVNGPVIHWLYDASGVNAPGGPFDANNPVSGTLTIEAGDLVDLLTGFFYVNVHTNANPSGEIRGQIGGVNLFAAALNGAQQSSPIHTTASGQAIMTLAADAQTLHYRLLIRDLYGITMAHIHRAPAGVNGPIIHWLYDPSGVEAPGGVFDDHNPVSGMLTLSNADIFDLLRGDFYVNIHTSANTGGEIRGQLGPHDAPDHFNALLSGREEVPAVVTEAEGVARFTYDSSLDILHYNVVVRDLVSPTMAHIHRALPGQNGPVVHWLYHDTGVNAPGGPWDENNPVAGGLMLNAEHTLDLLTGYYYVNAHTPAHPAGEIRGQIGGVQIFRAPLSGANEDPVVTTDATGLAVMALSADTSTMYYRLQVSNIVSITMAHIHLAPPGVNGPIVHWLYDPSGVEAPGGPFDPDNPVAGSLPFTTTHILDLVAGDYYVNVHTSSNPGGEIRGQLRPYQAATHYTAALSGDNEVTPVTTDAQGLANFTLYPGMDTLHYFITVGDIMSITMAHIHKAPLGVNGPVVHWLYDAAGVNAQGGPWDEDNPIGGALKLDAEHLVDLLTRHYYVNVHTSSNPGGEIRGQIYGLYRLYLPTLLQIETQ
jgi:hypothetical protein